MPSSPASDLARLWRVPALGDLELMHADHVAHEFPRHWHRTWVIELVTGGEDAFECGSARHVARAGDLIVMRPFEAHTGVPAGGERLRYRSLYPGDDLMARCAGGETPHFPRRVLRDPPLGRRLAEIHAALEADPADPAAAAALRDWLESLAARHAAGGPRVPEAPPPKLDAVRRFVERHAGRNVSLAEMSQVAGLTPFHFARRFRRDFGVAPHEHLLSVRIELARSLLRDGAAIADAALEAGFADQSHLTRQFKRTVGVTPGRYGTAQVRSRRALAPSARVLPGA